MMYGYILEMPGRPSLEEQLLSMRVAGVTNSHTYLMRDKLEKAKRTKNAGFEQLEERNRLRHKLEHGDIVVVADLTCLGVSEQDVERFLVRLGDKGVKVLVVAAEEIKPAKEDPAPFARRMAIKINNWRSNRSRGKV